MTDLPTETTLRDGQAWPRTTRRHRRSHGGEANGAMGHVRVAARIRQLLQRRVIAGAAEAPAPAPAPEMASPLHEVARLAAENERLRHELGLSRPRDGGPVRTALFAIGEPDMPGASLRSLAQRAVAGRAAIAARAVPLPQIGPHDIDGIDLLVLWRAPWSDHVETMIGLVRGAGGLVAFDADDLFIEPSLAHGAAIDGIRSLGFDRDRCAAFFAAMRRTAEAADFCLATTEPLAAALRAVNSRVHVLPNGFDDATRRYARRAAHEAARERAPGRIRIGYALGTRTHQRDVSIALPAIVRILLDRPAVRLVLFHEDGLGLLDVSEFPLLDAVADRIEWREAVPFHDLPRETARFDIAICPLETGNPFVEAKSEIKFVDAALAAIPLVASPTEPYRRAIRDGETGFLAASTEEWYDRLLALVDDADLRARIGRAASNAILWSHGPKRRIELLSSACRRHEAGARGAREAELAIRRGDFLPDRAIALPGTDILFDHQSGSDAEVAVAVTSWNYQRFIGEALASVAAQTLDKLELVVVDDGSTDGSIGVLLDWARAASGRFTRIRIERTRRNAGLGPTRNAAFGASHAPYVMSLDADNLLLPSCCETLLALAETADCAFAYSTIRQFGDLDTPISVGPFDPAALVRGNYIDAMALVARWAWSAAGGYYDNPGAIGWEDFDFWCRLAELGQFGVWHPEPLCLYRAHGGSMTNRRTEQEANKRALVPLLERRHPWLRLLARDARPR